MIPVAQVRTGRGVSLAKARTRVQFIDPTGTVRVGTVVFWPSRWSDKGRTRQPSAVVGGRRFTIRHIDLTPTQDNQETQP